MLSVFTFSRDVWSGRWWYSSHFLCALHDWMEAPWIASKSDLNINFDGILSVWLQVRRILLIYYINNNNNGFVNRSTKWLFPVKVCQLQLKINQIKSFTNYAIYIIKSRSRINRIEIKVKLTNRSVLCYIKNSLKFLKKVL